MACCTAQSATKLLNGEMMMTRLGFHLVSEAAIQWLYEMHPDVYRGFYDRVDQAAQQHNR